MTWTKHDVLCSYFLLYGCTWKKKKSIYRGLERVGSWVPGGSVGRDQLAMAAKVRRHLFNPCRLGSRGHLGADFSLLLYTDLIKKRKPSRHITDEGELIRDYFSD